MGNSHWYDPPEGMRVFILQAVQDAVNTVSVNDASTGAKGVVQLAGDLGGTAASPTVPGLAGKSTTLVETAVKTGPYGVAVNELAVMNVAGGGTTLTLPTAPADKALVGFRAIGATDSAPMTVQATGSDTLGTGGLTSGTVVLDGEVTVFKYDAANTRWLSIGNVKTLTSLDARFASREIGQANTAVAPAVPPVANAVTVKTVRQIQRFLDWLDSYGSSKGFISEIGWPGADTNGSWAGQIARNWNPVADAWLTVADTYDLGVSRWSDPAGQFAAVANPLTVAPTFTSGAQPMLRHSKGVGVRCLQAGGAAGVAPPAGFYNGNAGITAYPATNWFPTASWFKLVAAAGFTVARLSFRWESIQPALGGTLDAGWLAAIDAAIALAATFGLKVILDLHNYGGYQTVAYVNSGTPQQKIGGGTVTQAHLVDVWTKLSNHFAGNANVYAYELMNEPQGLAGGTYATTTNGTGSLTVGSNIIVASTAAFPSSRQFGVTVGTTTVAVQVADGTTLNIKASNSSGTWTNGQAVVSPQLQWEDVSQAVAAAIRGASDTTQILVPGYDFSAVSRWLLNHPQGWITGVSNFRYNAHHYWSSSASSDADYAITWAAEQAAQIFPSNSGGYFPVEGVFGGRLAGQATRLHISDGIPTLDRYRCTDILSAMVSGTLYVVPFLAEEDMTISKLAAMVGTTAASADTTVSRLGLFLVGADRGLILLGATAHTSSLFTTATAMTADINLASPVKIRQGVLYGLAALVVGGTTKPTLQGINVTSIPDRTRWPQGGFEKTGYSDMPSAVATGSMTTSNGIFYGRVMV